MEPSEKPTSKEMQVAKLEAELKRWGAKLDQLADKVGDTGADAKIAYRKQLDELKLKYKGAQSELSRLKAASSENWQGLMAGIKGVWNDVENAFNKLVN